MSDDAKKQAYKNRRPSRVNAIPENIQAPMRDRLKLLRESRGMFLRSVESLSGSTLTKYETHDIATMRLGDIFALAKEYGVTPEELVEYLLSAAEFRDTTPAAARKERMNVYMTALDEAHQELACDLVQRLVSHSVDASLQRTTAMLSERRQNTREALRNRLLQEEEEAV